jgi:hypothetical protein
MPAGRTISVDEVVLAIDSNWDTITKVAFNHRQAHVYPYLESKGFSIERCQGSLARRFYVADEAKKSNVTFITGVGHGLYNLYTGDHGVVNVIFQIGRYFPEEASNKIVHFLSCQTARDLGPDFVMNGCRAFLGYDENFTFFMAEADIFFECDSEIDRAIADGATVEQAHQRAVQKFNKAIAEMLAKGKPYVAAVLEFDRDHLQSPATHSRWGDRNASL